MKKYRGLTAFLLALTLCASLAGCGSTESATSNTSNTEVTNEAMTESVADEGEKDDARPGDPPDGEKPDAERPDAPPDGMGGGDPPGGGFGGGHSSSADIDYKGSTEITSADSQSGQTYSSDTADESALLISTSDDVTIESPTVTKTGDSDGGDS